jgi:hypothetical protein
MHTEIPVIENRAARSTRLHPPRDRFFVELKGGALKWLAIDSHSQDVDERELALRIWQATSGGRVGIVIELPSEFERLVADSREAAGDPRPARYIVYQRIDESGEILLRLRYFALAKFHYAQIPGADRSASLRQPAQTVG